MDLKVVAEFIAKIAPTINTMGGGQREPKIAELIPFGSYYTWKDNQQYKSTTFLRTRKYIFDNPQLFAGTYKIVRKIKIKGIVIDGVYYRIRK